MSTTITRPQLSHEEKITQLQAVHELKEKLRERAGPQHNKYVKMRKQQFKDQSHAKKR